MRSRLTLLVLLLATSPALGAEPDPRTAPLAAENPLYLQVDAPLDDRVADLIGRMTLEEKAIALNHNGPDLQRFGLRGDKWNQCLNGVQWDRPTTLFPSCIAMAATWDPAFVEEEIVRVLSDEARAIYNQWRLNPDIRSQHKGLIYRGEYIINWCPRCLTALSNEEAEGHETQGRLWHLRYPLPEDAWEAAEEAEAIGVSELELGEGLLEPHRR